MLIKTEMMSHQREAFRLMEGRKFFALAMEQGTGKTLVLLAHALREYSAGRVDGVCVIAPNGAHTNWILEEIPKHVPEHTPLRSAYWCAAPNKAERKALKDLFEPRSEGEVPPLRLLAANIEALNTTVGFEFIERFMLTGRTILIVDESQRIKNSRAACTKKIMRLRRLSEQRFISTGTMLDKPTDVFSQFQFMESGLLGTDSETAFKAEFCELLPPGHGLMRHIMSRTKGKYIPQVVAKDSEGRPIYRNLEKLQRLMAPHSFRVLKEECLDLPEKVYQTRHFHLTPPLRAAYDLMERDFRIQLEGGDLEPVSVLASLVKLQQITSGYVRLSDGTVKRIEKYPNPRIELLLDLVEDLEGSIIIWARFVQELDDICAALTERGESYVLIRGGVKPRERAERLRAFQSGEARIFVGQQQAGGTAITAVQEDATAASVIYHSNDFSLINRLQSEDRAHRIGQRNTVVYIDLIALDTIDAKIVSALQRKEEVAAVIQGDFQKHRSTRELVP